MSIILDRKLAHVNNLDDSSIDETRDGSSSDEKNPFDRQKIISWLANAVNIHKQVATYVHDNTRIDVIGSNDMADDKLIELVDFVATKSLLRKL